jgi:hypothetical protein
LKRFTVSVEQLIKELRATIDGGWNSEAAARLEDCIGEIKFLLKLTEGYGTAEDAIDAPLCSMRIKYADKDCGK